MHLIARIKLAFFLRDAMHMNETLPPFMQISKVLHVSGCITHTEGHQYVHDVDVNSLTYTQAGIKYHLKGKYLSDKRRLSNVAEVVSRYLKNTGVYWRCYARIYNAPVENCSPCLRVIVDVCALQQWLRALILCAVHCAPQYSVDCFLFRT